MSYVPLHDRIEESSLAPGPRYAAPDLDPSVPMSDYEDEPSSEYEEQQHRHEVQHGGYEEDAGPSRKRRREEDSNGGGEDHRGHGDGQELYGHDEHVPIQPSIFGIAPRNEFTKTVGEFVMAHCRGVDNVEIEIKLGTLHGPQAQPGAPTRRIRLPSLTEMIVPSDYPVGRFESNMTKAQHTSFNRLLNSAVEGTARSPTPLQFRRAQQVDTFHTVPGSGKVRVSRDFSGNVLRGGVVRKKRIADMNILSPREALDWRVSASIEDPADLPGGPPEAYREKDRACYVHQLCQVDLTVVTAKNSPKDPRPTVTYELEIEVLDVPSLIAEGEKEERGEDNRFDEMLQSVLDTARMLIRNV